MKQTRMAVIARISGLLAALLLTQACGGEVPATPEPFVPEATARTTDRLESEDILTQLQSIPGLYVLGERFSPFPGTRFFDLAFQLPADHRHPDGEQFSLYATLLHRSVEAPMVLYSGGYMLSTRPSQTEPTALLGGNQLSLEHRFFGSSRPFSNDGSLLRIEQVAGDYHRVIQALKPLYSGRWMTTGGSKGGKTAVYHRSLYPDDVDATVAYVAPNTRGLHDVSYALFLNRVGSEDCRARLRAFQREALRRREELRPHLDALSAATGYGFNVLGPDRTLEFGIVELPFYFWQYGDASWCETIPAPGASSDELFAFLDGVDDLIYTYADELLDAYAGYYHQAATELGWPHYPTLHLHHLLRYPGQNVPQVYLTFPVGARYNPLPTLRASHSTWSRGERMMFVDGENDPWSAAPFAVRERNDSFRFVVPDANHGNARILRLPEPERTLALERLFSWMGVSQQTPAARGAAPVWVDEASLGDIAPIVERRVHRRER
uniref:Lipoprotein n=1 Tax=Corallococcus coralloides TaxID=184914 RepID=A0A3S5GXQ2_CORCK|nr:lipoprotein [Corallococcus coralloides]